MRNSLSITGILAILIIGCTSGHCRPTNEVKIPQGPKETQPSNVKPSAGTVWVYKTDGSVQCSPGNEVSIERMAEELKGIQVLAQEKRSDDLMRAQVCGQETGRANLYLIQKESLSDAIKRGFKVWTFN